jgi:hypothetical protein
MRSALGSGCVLGKSGAATGDAEAEAEAALGGGALGLDDALLAGSPLPSAKLPGSTNVGAPGSVEKRADEQAATSSTGRTRIED